jgi:hypothetical protein
MLITSLLPGSRPVSPYSIQKHASSHKHSSSSTSTVRFGGPFATDKAKQELLSYKQLQELVLNDENPYLGKIPGAFLESSEAPEADWQKGMDWLAFKLQDPANVKHLKPSFFKKLFNSKSSSQNPVEQLFQKNQIKIRLLGAGIAGSVYQLNVNGQDFAFKVFNQERSSFDAYRESSTGLFFTEQETSNMSKFYAANPTGRWTLMEFIPPDAKLEDRAGKTLLEQNYKLSDDNDKNKVNNIRVDHGGIVTQIGVGYMAADAFKRFSQLKASQATQPDAMSIISVERPENLAATEAEWENEEDMDDNLPLSTLSMLTYQGNLSQRLRPHGVVRRPVEPGVLTNEQEEGPEPLPDLSETQRQAMLEMGTSAQRRRRQSTSQNP